MERRKFLKNCGWGCLSGSLLLALMESCNTSYPLVEGEIKDADLVLPVSSFKDKKNAYKKYIVVYHEKLKYPICIYRFNEKQYGALLMRCTHQGAELQVMGDMLYCPAHGSEFDNKGAVKSGPADNNLRTFPVVISNNKFLNISLK